MLRKLFCPGQDLSLAGVFIFWAAVCWWKAEQAARLAVFQLDGETVGIDYSLMLLPTAGTSEPLSLVFESMFPSRRTAT